MPQLETPFSYAGEWAQFTGFALLVLLVVSFVLVPSLTQIRLSLVLASTRKSSPLQQFASDAPSGLAAIGLNLVGLWGFIGAVVMVLAVAGSLTGLLLSPRSWALAVLASVLDTTRAVSGSEPATLGWLPVIASLILLVGGSNLLANLPGGYCLATSVIVAGSLSVSV